MTASSFPGPLRAAGLWSRRHAAMVPLGAVAGCRQIRSYGCGGAWGFKSGRDSGAATCGLPVGGVRQQVADLLDHAASARWAVELAQAVGDLGVHVGRQQVPVGFGEVEEELGVGDDVPLFGVGDGRLPARIQSVQLCGEGVEVLGIGLGNLVLPLV